MSETVKMKPLSPHGRGSTNCHKKPATKAYTHFLLSGQQQQYQQHASPQFTVTEKKDETTSSSTEPWRVLNRWPNKAEKCEFHVLVGM